MSTVSFQTFPRTEAPAEFVRDIAGVFEAHAEQIGTRSREKGLTSDEVLSVIRDDLVSLGFSVERGKRASEKIHRPVFYGENGEPMLKYEVDAYHSAWRCGLEVEAGRAWMGNAIYRDLVQALVMVEVDTLVLAVSQAYKYSAGGRPQVSRDYENAVRVADTLFGHSRFVLPYRLLVIGY